jgi:PAS domain S-box-containing protein
MQDLSPVAAVFPELPLLLEAFPFPAWLSNREGDVESVNEAWVSYTGLSRSASLGRGWLQAVALPERLRTSGRFCGAYSAGQPDCFETLLVRADGEGRWNRARAIPLRDRAGGLVRWLATWSDLDEHVRTTERLRIAAAASAALLGNGGIEETFRAFAAILVPQFADWFTVRRLEADGRLRVVFAHHREPALAAVARSIVGSDTRLPRAGYTDVVRGRGPRLNAFANLDALVASLRAHGAPASYVAAIAALGYRSGVTVPLIHGRALVGTIHAIRSAPETGRYDVRDVSLFGEIAPALAAAIAQASAFDALVTSYEHERRVATVLQSEALPKQLPRAFGLRIDGHYTPAHRDERIGGDWYDATRLRDGRILLSIGDVLGNGLDAAVTMGSLRQIVRTAARLDPEPARILASADETLREDRPGTIATAFVGVYDPVTMRLRYASAGHPPPLVRAPDRTIAELHLGGLPLGLRERDGETHELAIAPGSLLVLYTDGLTESTRDLFEGERRLRAAIHEPSVRHAQNVAHAIHRTVLFDGASDDVAVLTVAFPAKSDETSILRWSPDARDLRALQAVRAEFHRFLATRHADPDRSFGAEVVLGELLSNAHRYAPGPLEVVVDSTGDDLVVHVLDDGPGFCYRPSWPAASLSEGGRGLALVDAFALSCSVTARPEGGSHVRVVL